jgi:hypothetical protein
MWLLSLCLLSVVHYICTTLFVCVIWLAHMCASWLSHMLVYQPNDIFMSLLYFCLLWVVHQTCTSIVYVRHLACTACAGICASWVLHMMVYQTNVIFMSLLYLCLLWVVHQICTLLFCVRHLSCTGMCASWLSHMLVYQPNVQSPTGGPNPRRWFHAQRVVAQQNDTPRVPSLTRRNLYESMTSGDSWLWIIEVRKFPGPNTGTQFQLWNLRNF